MKKKYVYLFPSICYVDESIILFYIILFQAVTKAKLGYHPLEVNPEDMVRFAKEKPQVWMSGNDFSVVCRNALAWCT